MDNHRGLASTKPQLGIMPCSTIFSLSRATDQTVRTPSVSMGMPWSIVNCEAFQTFVWNDFINKKAGSKY